MWKELEQFHASGIAGGNREAETIRNSKKFGKGYNNGKKNSITGHARPSLRKQKPTDPVVFENKGLKSVFRPKTANE